MANSILTTRCLLTRTWDFLRHGFDAIEGENVDVSWPYSLFSKIRFPRTQISSMFSIYSNKRTSRDEKVSLFLLIYFSISYFLIRLLIQFLVVVEDLKIFVQFWRCCTNRADRLKLNQSLSSYFLLLKMEWKGGIFLASQIA